MEPMNIETRRSAVEPGVTIHTVSLNDVGVARIKQVSAGGIYTIRTAEGSLIDRVLGWDTAIAIVEAYSA